MTTEEAINSLNRKRVEYQKLLDITPKHTKPYPETRAFCEALDVAIAALRAQQEEENQKPMTLSEWISVKDRMPENGIVVWTKIHDETGIRNEQELRRSDNLWCLPDRPMYVYYTPTHWLPLPEPPKEGRQ